MQSYIHDCLCLTRFIEQGVFKLHSCYSTCQHGSTFYGCIMFHYMDGPYLVYFSFHWEASGVSPVFAYCDQGMNLYEQHFIWYPGFSSLWWMPMSSNLGTVGILHLTFWWATQIAFYSVMVLFCLQVSRLSPTEAFKNIFKLINQETVVCPVVEPGL